MSLQENLVERLTESTQLLVLLAYDEPEENYPRFREGVKSSEYQWYSHELELYSKGDYSDYLKNKIYPSLINDYRTQRSSLAVIGYSVPDELPDIVLDKLSNRFA
jgi:hypothetical protein